MFIINPVSYTHLRWTFLLTLFNILIACWLLEHDEILNVKMIYPTAVGIAVFCLSIVPLSAIIEGKLNSVFETYGIQIVLFAVCAFLIILYSILLKRKAINLLIVLTILEFGISGSIHYINKMDTSERGLSLIHI